MDNATEYVKPLVLTDKETGKEYVLDYNVDAVRFAEQRGFDVDELGKYPVTKIPELWYYAFRKNHKDLAKNQTDALLGKVGGASARILNRLQALWMQAMDAANIITSDEEIEKNANVVLDFGD